MSLKAGGVGLTLTAADQVFLMDPWWNPAAEDQAADRAHRIGQRNPVIIHRMVAEGTIEERILELQKRKRELARAVMEEADTTASLTREDLLELLR
jgi:SNF2 family DNA or RNA helicase